MGGGRCYFRDCHVSYHRFSAMHFFHFPLKDAERYKRWRQFAQMEKILEFTNVRRNNTCVCARHFRPECFMNYKMDRLSPNAVPTLMRLSEDKALDFELDIENGVLVDLKKPTLKHLIPPDSFESPLQLKNDKILIEKLNELNFSNVNVEYLDISESQESVKEPTKATSKSVEIIESIQVAAPSLKKRPMKHNENVSQISNKRRILNTSNIVGNKNNSVSISAFKPQLFQLETATVENNEITFIEAVQEENSSESERSDDNLILATESFDNTDDCDDGIEFLEVQKNISDSQIAFNTNDDNNEIIVEIKSELQAEKGEVLNADQLLNFNQMKNDFDSLRVKYAVLENENKELRSNCHQAEELKKNFILLQKENNNLKNSLTNFDSIKEKFHTVCVENKTLKMECEKLEAMKSELLSRREETKELKKLLEAVRNDNTKTQNFELEIKNKELKGLSKKLEQSQQELSDTVNKLKVVQNKLNALDNENKNLTRKEENYEKTLKDLKTRHDLKQKEFNALNTEFDCLQQNYSLLEQKCWKLEAMKNQESTVSTSLQNGKESNPAVVTAPTIAGSSLTKAQLFNGIKRYLCASMVALLRMEMFGSSEREWKTDERQVSTDLLQLGEPVYKYFIDEWRIRLPALRDARYWLSQKGQLVNDEEDL